ncbi:unnamed protein product [Caenorhabditis bovis]|uniref:Uncharacterized protein n=1 Tax=Caenorhabditis bovis TaxID=2654633 RepID=A0A8S1EZB7_9PELO|nr:unnamed protein product [Caenorhabditis bovis]
MNGGSVFETLHQQFGAPHYSESGDRKFAPNVFVFVSDNFGTYSPDVWNAFTTQIASFYGCSDAMGNPQIYFLSRSDRIVNIPIGSTITLSADDLNLDPNDGDSLVSSFTKFNGFVDTICGISPPVWINQICS